MVNGIVLPFVLVFMLLLINKRELMGEYTNSRLFNMVAWAHGGHDRADHRLVLDVTPGVSESAEPLSVVGGVSSGAH